MKNVSSFRERRARRDFLLTVATCAAGFPLLESATFATQPATNPAENARNYPKSMRMAVFSGYVADLGHELEDEKARIELKVRHAAALWNPRAAENEIKKLVKGETAPVDLKKLLEHVDSAEKLQVALAIRRLMHDTLDKENKVMAGFESALQWDLERVERFTRSRVEELSKDLNPWLDLLAHPNLSVPPELQKWMKAGDRELHTLKRQLERQLNVHVPASVAGLITGSELLARAREDLNNLRQRGVEVTDGYVQQLKGKVPAFVVELTKASQLQGQAKDGLEKLRQQGLKEVNHLKALALNAVLDVKIEAEKDVKQWLARSDGVIKALGGEFSRLEQGGAKILAQCKAEFDKAVSGFSSFKDAALPGAASFALAGAVAGAVGGFVVGLMLGNKLEAINQKLKDIDEKLASIQNTLGNLTSDMEKVRRDLTVIRHDLSNFAANLRSEQRDKVDNLISKDTMLPRDKEGACALLQIAVHYSGGPNCISCRTIHSDTSITSSQSSILERPLPGSVSRWAYAVHNGLLNPNSFADPESHQGGDPETLPFPNISMWCEGAGWALRSLSYNAADSDTATPRFVALSAEEHLKEEGGKAKTVKEALEGIAKQGRKIQDSLLEVADGQKVSDLMDQFIDWWTDDHQPGGKSLRTAISAERKANHLIKLVPVGRPFKHLYELDSEFWARDKTHYYYVDVDPHTGENQLFEIYSQDTARMSTQDKSYKESDRGLDPFDYDAKDVYSHTSPPKRWTRLGKGSPSAGSSSPNAHTSEGQFEVTYCGGQKGVLLERATFREVQLGLGSRPRMTGSVLRYSKDPRKQASRLLLDAYVTHEQSTQTLKTAINRNIDNQLQGRKYPGAITRLTQMFGILGGAITIAAWHNANNGYELSLPDIDENGGVHDPSPPLIDGKIQIPGCVPGMVELFCRDSGYADLDVKIETVMSNFKDELNARKKAALKVIEDCKAPSVGIPVLTRTIYDLENWFEKS